MEVGRERYGSCPHCGGDGYFYKDWFIHDNNICTAAKIIKSKNITNKP